jgi:hypothetical protein
VEGSVLAAGSVFREDVWSFLPYVETVTQREYDYDYVMIDGERILGLKVCLEYSLEQCVRCIDLRLLQALHTPHPSEFGTSPFDVHVLG